MTNQEIIEIITNVILTEKMKVVAKYKALSIVQKAVKKQIPKKVIEQTEEVREFIDYDCPCCKTILQQCIKPERKLRFHGRTNCKYKHCPYCGQALDWSDT